ncbi:hypothetical protein PCH70_01800 [Pseudomonas cichorii JBC1]|nr:hypothetical protein PCH70_01800 [Pseudomonas cichorii JBC1]
MGSLLRKRSGILTGPRIYAALIVERQGQLSKFFVFVTFDSSRMCVYQSHPFVWVLIGFSFAVKELACLCLSSP